MIHSLCHEKQEDTEHAVGVDSFDRTVSTYDVGETVVPGPRDRGVKRDMRYLIAYDVCKPKRLRHVASICESYGVRVQKSVFECDLESGQFEMMWNELTEALDPDEDFLAAYPICRSCASRVSSAGVMVRPEAVLAYIC